MNANEALLAAQILDAVADEYRKHACNDWEFPPDWTLEERAAFVKEYHEYTGNPHEFDPHQLVMDDYDVMNLLACKLRRSANQFK